MFGHPGLFRRQLHVVAVKAAQVLVVIADCLALDAFEFYFCVVFKIFPRQRLLPPVPDRQRRHQRGAFVLMLAHCCIELPGEAAREGLKYRAQEPPHYLVYQPVMGRPAHFCNQLRAPQAENLAAHLPVAIEAGDVVQREDVHPEPAAVEECVRAAFGEADAGAHVRHHRVQVVRDLLPLHQAVVAVRLEARHEAVVVRARHQDVDVVVPRDEAPVPDGADERAVAQGVADAVLPAEGVYLAEDAQQVGAALFYGQGLLHVACFRLVSAFGLGCYCF